MELNQIRYFVVMARTLHFSKAAEACNVSQPALTKAIQKLEEELGGQLFLRERSHTQLTELGRVMLGTLERALDAANDAKAQAAAFRRRECSPLRVGLEHSVPAALLTPVLAVLRRQHDDIEISLRQSAQTDLCERMLAGELDFSLLVDMPDLPDRLHRWKLFSEGYVVLCPQAHRFQDHAEVTMGELANESLLMNEDAACPVRRFITDAFAHAGVKPRRMHLATSQEQILEMVVASLGVSIAGEMTTCTQALMRRPLCAAPGCRDVVLTTVAGRRLGPTAALFMKLMRARTWSQAASSQAVAA